MLQEPSYLQQWICQLAQEQRKNVVRMPGDFEREIDQTRHSQDVMEFHNRMFPMHKAPEQVKHEVAHAVREYQWAGNDA